MTNSSGTHHKYKGKKNINKMSKNEKTKFFMRQNKKIIKVKVSKEDQEEINKIREKCMFKPEPIKEEFEIECLFG